MLDRLIDRIADRVVAKLEANKPQPATTVETHYYYPQLDQTAATLGLTRSQADSLARAYFPLTAKETP